MYVFVGCMLLYLYTLSIVVQYKRFAVSNIFRFIRYKCYSSEGVYFMRCVVCASMCPGNLWKYISCQRVVRSPGIIKAKRIYGSLSINCPQAIHIHTNIRGRSRRFNSLYDRTVKCKGAVKIFDFIKEM